RWIAKRRAASPPPMSSPSRRAKSPATRASRSRDCVSASGDMAPRAGKDCTRDLIGAGGFAQQSRERWNVGVPFDQGRLRSEPADRMSVEVPDWFGDPLGMRIDEDLGAWHAVIRLARETTQMQFADRISGECADVAVGVVAHVVRTEMDVADVAQQPTSGSLRELAHELSLR